MTKEEIEKLAANLANPNACKTTNWIEGYNQCQEDMSKISEWQLCPKCFGEGQVSNIGTSSSIYRICPVCNGNKTLIKPII